MREKPVHPHTEQKWDTGSHFRKQKNKEGYMKNKEEKQEVRIADLNAKKPHKKV